MSIYRLSPLLKSPSITLALPKTNPQRHAPKDAPPNDYASPKTESHFAVSVCAFASADGRHFGYFQAYFA